MNEQHEQALNQALQWIQDTYQPIGIVVSGSIVRGNGHANSDLDIYVIHEADYRQRVQKLFNGVPCEILVNTMGHTELYFEAELKNNRPVTAHILATGVVHIGSENETLQELIASAKEYINKTEPLNEGQLAFKRYGLANLLEDATDVVETDKPAAQHILDKLMQDVMAFVYHTNGKPLPRIKERLALLHEADAAAASLVVQYYAAASVEERYAIAKSLIEILVGESGFFEWSSERE